jgi:hypothetical protein
MEYLVCQKKKVDGISKFFKLKIRNMQIIWKNNKIKIIKNNFKK